MAKYECTRCGVMENTTNPPHLCKDVAARLARRERQVKAILPILFAADENPNLLRRAVAEDIIAVLMNLNVEGD